MADLPSGAVTFLFTDIEGSTRLVKQLRDRYGDVLAEHQRLLREAFEAHKATRSTRKATRSSWRSRAPATRCSQRWMVSGRSVPIRGPTGSKSGCAWDCTRVRRSLPAAGTRPRGPPRRPDRSRRPRWSDPRLAGDADAARGRGGGAPGHLATSASSASRISIARCASTRRMPKGYLPSSRRCLPASRRSRSGRFWRRPAAIAAAMLALVALVGAAAAALVRDDERR